MGLNLEYSSGQTPINADEIDGLKINTIVNQGELNEFEQLNTETSRSQQIHSAYRIRQKLLMYKNDFLSEKNLYLSYD